MRGMNDAHEEKKGTASRASEAAGYGSGRRGVSWCRPDRGVHWSGQRPSSRLCGLGGQFRGGVLRAGARYELQHRLPPAACRQHDLRNALAARLGPLGVYRCGLPGTPGRAAFGGSRGGHRAKLPGLKRASSGRLLLRRLAEDVGAEVACSIERIRAKLVPDPQFVLGGNCFVLTPLRNRRSADPQLAGQFSRVCEKGDCGFLG